jgi:antitoxin HicB
MTYYKLPLVFTPQPEGGFTVTCPVLPELLTEGDTLEEANANVADALAAVVEIYRDTGRPLPSGLAPVPLGDPLWTETLVPLP